LSINSIKCGVYIMVVKNVEQLNSLKSDVQYMISIMVEDALAQTDEFYEYLSIEDALEAVKVFPATVENTEALVC
jgi:isochorismate hydrolase